MEELTPAQLQELQQDLHLLQEQLAKLLIESEASSETVDLDQPIGRLSRIDALQQQEMAKANRAGNQRRLKLIESSLSMIKQDRYGDCRRCEEPIGYPRLKARPESPFCLTCQGQYEEER